MDPPGVGRTRRSFRLRSRLRRRPRLDEVDGREPMVTHVRGALARGGGDRVAPGRGGVLAPRLQVVEEVWGGLDLDQAAQAEADVPALVELDAPHALAHPGQGT